MINNIQNLSGQIKSQRGLSMKHLPAQTATVSAHRVDNHPHNTGYFSDIHSIQLLPTIALQWQVMYCAVTTSVVELNHVITQRWFPKLEFRRCLLCKKCQFKRAVK